MSEEVLHIWCHIGRTASWPRTPMSLIEFVLVLFAPWCIIHTLRYLLIRHRSGALLPVYSAVIDGPYVTLNGLHLRVSTTKWNAYHDKVITFFEKRRNQRVTTSVIAMYNLGVLLGALGMIFVILLCLTESWRALVERRIDVSGNRFPPSNLLKRLVEDINGDKDPSLSARNQSPVVTPIVCKPDLFSTRT